MVSVNKRLVLASCILVQMYFFNTKQLAAQIGALLFIILRGMGGGKSGNKKCSHRA
jgi:hypothetical protein